MSAGASKVVSGCHFGNGPRGFDSVSTGFAWRRWTRLAPTLYVGQKMMGHLRFFVEETHSDPLYGRPETKFVLACEDLHRLIMEVCIVCAQ